ncbi:hypothetical protein [Maridesulfovibrio sp.]|uniref:hypothetical protein n=1 Tax=Maridesulfovibrio sp. TaxID=2795000 RepID=UPI0029CA3FDD|nr:hypothetical protein [Maridesulfovibrio sp.]
MFEYFISPVLVIVLLLSPVWFLKLVYQTFGMLKKADIEKGRVVFVSWLAMNVVLSIPVAKLALVGNRIYTFSFISPSFEWVLAVVSYLGIPLFTFFVFFFVLQRIGLFKRLPAGFWSRQAGIGVSLTWILLAYFLYESSLGG